MTSEIKGLLFDKDGTLFDFRTTWGAWARQFFQELADGDISRATDMSAEMGFDYGSREFSKESIIIAGTPDQITTALLAVAPGRTAREMVDHINRVAAQVQQAEPVPLGPLLEGFRGRGMQLGVATNDAEEVAQAHLGGAGITHLLDFIAGYDSGYGAKPATGMQRAFCAATGLMAAEVAMVGDSTHDLISGRDAGMTTIAVLTGMAEEPDLAPYADVVLPHIGEIPEFLGHL